MENNIKIRVINGPGLNFLGIREPEIYGARSLDEMNAFIKQEVFRTSGSVDTEFFQSNTEGEIINCLQACYYDKVSGIVINPGAFTHYSYAIRDAVSGIGIKTVEVHLSNIYGREEFRHKSVIAAVCAGQISGLGALGYVYAVNYLLSLLKS